MIELVGVSNPILYTRCSPVADPTKYRETIEQMLEALEPYSAAGLAAPQIGIPKRFFVMRYTACFNPEILKQSEAMDVGAEDETGKWQETTLWHWDARVFSHELDHLNGKLITEYQ